MNILIIEDDLNKARQLLDFLRMEFANAEIREQHSYQSGLRDIILSRPQIVVLDMTMPTFDISPTEKGGRTRPYAGRDILMEIRRRKIVSAVVVVTQFESFGEQGESMTLEQLHEQLGREFSGTYVGVVFYQAAESGWRDELRRAVLSVVCGVGQ